MKLQELSEWVAVFLSFAWSIVFWRASPSIGGASCESESLTLLVDTVFPEFQAKKVLYVKSNALQHAVGWLAERSENADTDLRSQGSESTEVWQSKEWVDTELSTVVEPSWLQGRCFQNLMLATRVKKGNEWVALDTHTITHLCH
jgi:hypothetical protein